MCSLFHTPHISVVCLDGVYCCPQARWLRYPEPPKSSSHTAFLVVRRPKQTFSSKQPHTQKPGLHPPEAWEAPSTLNTKFNPLQIQWALCMYMCEHTYVTVQVQRSGTTSGSQFSPITWVPGIKTSSPGLVAITSTH